mmetsp:Transcript_17191/g.20678  ORF Transcript_17191/g.20678 Transcript_17191/m.20678 type:complete len:343 (+) Transcript_17191:927-1955(+)
MKNAGDGLFAGKLAYGDTLQLGDIAAYYPVEIADATSNSAEFDPTFSTLVPPSAISPEEMVPRDQIFAGVKDCKKYHSTSIVQYLPLLEEGPRSDVEDFLKSKCVPVSNGDGTPSTNPKLVNIFGNANAANEVPAFSIAEDGDFYAQPEHLFQVTCADQAQTRLSGEALYKVLGDVEGSKGWIGPDLNCTFVWPRYKENLKVGDMALFFLVVTQTPSQAGVELSPTYGHTYRPGRMSAGGTTSIYKTVGHLDRVFNLDRASASKPWVLKEESSKLRKSVVLFHGLEDVPQAPEIQEEGSTALAAMYLNEVVKQNVTNGQEAAKKTKKKLRLFGPLSLGKPGR